MKSAKLLRKQASKQCTILWCFVFVSFVSFWLFDSSTKDDAVKLEILLGNLNR